MSEPTGRGMNLLRAGIGLVLVGELIAASVLAGSRVAPPTAPLTIAVVGDQNTAGIKNRVVWPTLMANRTGWSVANFALPNAGFAADGMGDQAFANQVDRAQAAKPQIILLVTGTADASVPDPEAVTVGVADAINKVIRGGERAAVVGPMWYETPVPGSLWQVNGAVEEAASAAGVPFFNALDPPLLTRQLMRANLGGPSDEGQSVIADKIAAWLRTQVVR